MLPFPALLQVREESGINSFADVAQLLENAPKPLLDSLRQGTVVRHTGKRRRAGLGCQGGLLKMHACGMPAG